MRGNRLGQEAGRRGGPGYERFTRVSAIQADLPKRIPEVRRLTYRIQSWVDAKRDETEFPGNARASDQSERLGAVVHPEAHKRLRRAGDFRVELVERVQGLVGGVVLLAARAHVAQCTQRKNLYAFRS
jgi:hypothetical protein